MINLIQNMISELQDYKHDKSVLMQTYISDRLNSSFDTYSKELQQSILFLTQKHEKSLLKRLNKIDNKRT